MTGATRPDLPAANECEHFYASHCYRGMSIRLCMACHEPDWDDLAGQLNAARDAVAPGRVPVVTSPAPDPGGRSATATGTAEGDWRERAEQAEAQRDRVRESSARALVRVAAGISEQRDRAEAAEAKLAAVADYCKTSARVNYGLVKAAAILAITGTGEEAGND